MNGKTVFCWEFTGFFIITIIGTLLHFCFEWSGYLKPLALFCAVNESVWEHLKLGFWPGLAFAFLEFALWGRYFRNFWVAKTIALYIIPITIILLFYTYTSILGTHLLVFDIAIFIISILLSQIVSYRMITSDIDFSMHTGKAVILLAILEVAFCLFSFFPPKLQLFMDPRNGSFGIPVKW